MDKKSLDRNMEVATHLMESKPSIIKKEISEAELGQDQIKTEITPSEKTFKYHLYRSLNATTISYVS